MEDQDRETRTDEEVEGHANLGNANTGAPHKGREDEGEDVEGHVNLNAVNKGMHKA
jgi:hypothetical protein